MLSLALALLGSFQEPAFEPRYELGQRVRALERAFLAEPPEAPGRAALILAAERAVERFFRGDFAGAAQALDGAFGPAFGAGWVLVPERRLAAADAEQIELLLWRWYGPLDPRPSALSIQIGAETRALELSPPTDGGAEGALWRADLPLADLPSGDLRLELRLGFPADARGLEQQQPSGTALLELDGPTVPRPLWLSLVPDLEPRLSALEAGLAALGSAAPALEAASLADNLALLRELADGPAGETDFPAARLLADSEALLAAAARGERWFSAERPGEHWLSVPTAKRPTRVRLWLPADLAQPGSSSRPLVLALHGAGGSENLWFDGYGDGSIRRLCEQRGWILAAPRLGLLGGGAPEALPAALAERYPIDLSRVFVVGHSMGAARALSLASDAPSLPAALVLLGGGRALRNPEPLRRLPIWIAAGERDFGRPGAEALFASLRRGEPAPPSDPAAARGETLHRLWIAPEVEHLLIVPAALPAAFVWLDALAAEPPR
jgi:pimeloyl-ACP methyl ester carboxylesterase